MDLLCSRFTGKERDTETGLDYFGARYLSGVMGRFTSADAPFADQVLDSPQSWNLYSYVGGDPLGSVDYDGRGKVKAFLVVLQRLNIGDTVRVVRHNKPHVKLSTSEARDTLRRKGGSAKFPGESGSVRATGKNRTEHGPHQSVPPDQRQPHNRPGAQKAGGETRKMKGHAFYAGGILMLPGSTIGTDILGDNLFGSAVDLINPVADMEDTFNIFNQVIVPATFGFADDYLMKPIPREPSDKPIPAGYVESVICFEAASGCSGSN